MDRAALFYALLLSIPPGIGIVGFTVMMTGGGLINELGVVAGVVAAAAIFVVVLLGASGEDPQEFEEFAK